MELNALVVQKMNEWRLDHHISQTQLATIVSMISDGVLWSQATVSRIESCQRVLDLVELQVLCEVMGTSPTELVS